jgi:hypothetical protein
LVTLKYQTFHKLTSFSTIECLQKDWQSHIYAFLHADVAINYVDGRRVHDFTCSIKNCKEKGKIPRLVRRYLDTTDHKSTSSLGCHAKQCWGEETVTKAAEAKNVQVVREGLKTAELKDGSIMAVFERTGKGKVTCSHRPHTNEETR